MSKEHLIKPSQHFDREVDVHRIAGDARGEDDTEAD